MTPVYGIAMTCESSFGIYQCHRAGSDRTALTLFQTSNMHEKFDKIVLVSFLEFCQTWTIACARTHLTWHLPKLVKANWKLNCAMRLSSQFEPLTVYHDKVMLTVWVPQKEKWKSRSQKFSMPGWVSCGCSSPHHTQHLVNSNLHMWKIWHAKHGNWLLKSFSPHSSTNQASHGNIVCT